MKRGFVITLLGAESTGKTTLAGALTEALAAEGHSVANVAEYLREFCVAAGRTPAKDEQAAIAAEQTRRIAEAAATHDVVVADTSALMVAIYSDFVFADTSLHDAALADHGRAGLTLLTALDLPWQPDGLQREGPHVQPPIDALLRAAMDRGRIGYTVVAGSGPARLASAMKAVRHAMGRASAADEQAANPPWRWVCERCGDADCERRLLPHLEEPS